MPIACDYPGKLAIFCSHCEIANWTFAFYMAAHRALFVGGQLALGDDTDVLGYEDDSTHYTDPEDNSTYGDSSLNGRKHLLFYILHVVEIF